MRDGHVVSVNESHPRVQPAIQALDRFRAFVQNPSEEFVKQYEEENSDQLSFTNRGFWERHLP